jgi:phosphopantetheinyl transferase
MRPALINNSYARLTEALPGDAANRTDCLGERELIELSRLTDEARRRQWLAGRWLAKQLLAHQIGQIEPSRLQILTRDDRGLGVRARVFHGAQELGVSLSIAHSAVAVIVATCDARSAVVGVDLVDAQLSVGDSFFSMWFSARERQWMDRDRPRRGAVLWGIKEAAYKATNSGQPWNPRDVEVVPVGSADFAATYRGRALHGLSVETAAYDDQLAVLVSLARFAPSTRIESRTKIRSAVNPNTTRSLGKQARFIVG